MNGQQRTDTGRRVFLRTAMAGGLLAGYGTWVGMAGRFLYSSPAPTRRWQFVATVQEFPVGHAMTYIAPDGQRVLVTRQAGQETAEAFLALSSVCPHLGCQVHWEPHHERFFCPCHNGVFDRNGVAQAGPPAAARQVLTRFPLKVDRGRLFILAPVGAVGELACGARQGGNPPQASKDSRVQRLVAFCRRKALRTGEV